MFDPTIYENIKIVLEGEIYDLDLSRKITVIKRKDLVDLASLSRTFIMGFQLMDETASQYAEIELIAKAEDLTQEILEFKSDNIPGCEIKLHFYTKISSPQEQCLKIEEEIGRIWDYRPKIVQVLSYQISNENKPNEFLKLIYNNQITLYFDRKIDEGNIDDIHELLSLTVRSLEGIIHIE